MQFSDITTWSVSKGVARPKNDFTNPFIPTPMCRDCADEDGKCPNNNYAFCDPDLAKIQYSEFEQFAQQHGYATNAPDGSYSADRFGEIVWQFMNVKFEWINCVSNDPSFSKAHGFSTRQFLPFINQVKEAEIPKFGEWISDRFLIYDEGTPLLQFESEVHIKDTQNEEYTIVIKSGYSDLEPTKIIAQKILKILNNGHSSKSA
jgi:hypothetical protein